MQLELYENHQLVNESSGEFVKTFMDKDIL